MASLLISSLLMVSLAGCGEAGDENVTAPETTATEAAVGSHSTTEVPHSTTVTGFTYPYETTNVSVAPDTGLVLARVELTIVNNGDTDYEANANMFALEDASGEGYVHYLFYDGDDAMGESRDSNVLAPGEVFEGALVFDVPPGLYFVGLREGLGYPDSGDLYPLP